MKSFVWRMYSSVSLQHSFLYDCLGQTNDFNHLFQQAQHTCHTWLPKAPCNMHALATSMPVTSNGYRLHTQQSKHVPSFLCYNQENPTSSCAGLTSICVYASAYYQSWFVCTGTSSAVHELAQPCSNISALADCRSQVCEKIIIKSGFPRTNSWHVGEF